MTKDKSVVTVKAPERMTVDGADVLMGELVAAAEDCNSIRVDLSAVVAADTAGIQLLVVLKQSVEAGGGHCELDGAPPSLLERARLLGVQRILDLA